MPATRVRCSVPTSIESFINLREFGTFSAVSTLATRRSILRKSSMVMRVSVAAGVVAGLAAGAAAGRGGGAGRGGRGGGGGGLRGQVCPQKSVFVGFGVGRFIRRWLGLVAGREA